MVSCKKEATSEVDGDVVDAPKKPELTQVCYEGILKNDTITMQLSMTGTDVRSGELKYNFFEKDKNTGHISDIRQAGDTLLANYAFLSEGKMSYREVVFLRKGNILIEGYGDVEADSTGKMIFKDKKKIFFDSKTILAKINCK